MKVIYVNSLCEHNGKTTFSLGLAKLFSNKGFKTAYFKPVSQRKVFDEEAYVRILNELNFISDIAIVNPIVFERGTSQRKISKEKLFEKITNSLLFFKQRQIEIVIMEGAGNAAVGSIMGISNAQIGHKYGLNPVLIARAGIGQLYDNYYLNYNFYKSYECDICGIIINGIESNIYEEYIDKFYKAVSVDKKIYGFIRWIDCFANNKRCVDFLNFIGVSKEMLLKIDADVLNKKCEKNFITSNSDTVNILLLDSIEHKKNINMQNALYFVCDKDNVVFNIKEKCIIEVPMSINMFLKYYDDFFKKPLYTLKDIERISIEIEKQVDWQSLLVDAKEVNV